MNRREYGEGVNPSPRSYWGMDERIEKLSNLELWVEFHTADLNIRAKSDALREMARRVGRRLQLATARGMSAELYEREVKYVLQLFKEDRVKGHGCGIAKTCEDCMVPEWASCLKKGD